MIMTVLQYQTSSGAGSPASSTFLDIFVAFVWGAYGEAISTRLPPPTNPL